MSTEPITKQSVEYLADSETSPKEEELHISKACKSCYAAHWRIGKVVPTNCGLLRPIVTLGEGTAVKCKFCVYLDPQTPCVFCGKFF